MVPEDPSIREPGTESFPLFFAQLFGFKVLDSMNKKKKKKKVVDDMNEFGS